MEKNFLVKISSVADIDSKKCLSLQKDFFENNDDILVDDGKLEIEVITQQHQKKKSKKTSINYLSIGDIISIDFKIEGHITLICDRSLEYFEYPLSIDKKVLFELKEEDNEIEEDYYTIDYKTTHINIVEHLNDFINLAIPYKKLHPRLSQDEDKSL